MFLRIDKEIFDYNKYKELQLFRNYNPDRVEQLVFNRLTRYISLNKDSNIIDVGCKSGITIRNLLNSGYKNAYGLDIGDKTWDDIPYNLKNNFILCDIHEGIPLNLKFDLIICSHAFEHFYDPEKVIEIFKKHLNHNGYIYISVPIDFTRFHKEKDHLQHYSFFESEMDLNKFLINHQLEIIESYTIKNGVGDFPEIITVSKLI
jgi:2-polyprenyl-3-methyl-5-hydroxy-6-metoxy-1,4-benzoquinol methylase